MNQQIKTSIGAGVIIILSITIGFFTWKIVKIRELDSFDIAQVPIVKKKIEKMVACTQEAKQCPDGTYVSRTEPGCQFAACPEEKLSGLLQTYRNEKLGFEINIPKKVSDGSIETIEKGNAVWIVAGDSYEKRDNLKQFSNSISDFERVQGIPWAILVETVNNDQELEKFIKNRYGKECKLGEKSPSTQEGVFDIKVDTGNGLPGEGCFLNWVLVIEYSPKLHKVAAWDIGQAVTFMSSEIGIDKNNIIHDEEMAKSFKFIN